MRVASRLPFVLALVSVGCLAGFKHPLGPASSSTVDDRLLGAWKCSDRGGGQLMTLAFVNFDGRQYFARMTDGKKESGSYRALGHQIGDSTFLSLRVIEPKAEDEWTILEYRIESSTLRLRDVKPGAFEDLMDDPRAVRESLAARLDDPDAIGDFAMCHQSDAVEPKTQE